MELDISWIDDEYNGRTITGATITDHNGTVWEYDAYAYAQSRRELRVIEADSNFPPGEEHNNGYCVSSFDEAIITLVEGGHL